MLVLSRKKNESVVIGDRVVTVTVVEIRGDKVRLSFEADESIPIDRIEVWHAKQRGLTDGTNAS